MKSLLVLALLSVVLVGGVGIAFAETETLTYETIPYGIYVIHFEYEGEGKYEFTWEEKSQEGEGRDKLRTGITEFTTDKESVTFTITTDNVDFRITDVEYKGQLSPEQMKTNFPETIEDPKDQRIVELEQRINELEDLVIGLQNLNDGLDSANKELVKINDGLQDQVTVLQEQMDEIGNQFASELSQLNEWFVGQVDKIKKE